MERGFLRGCKGDRLSAKGAEATSATSMTVAMPLASSPGGRTGGMAGTGGIDGRLEQVGPEQGRGFSECSARGICGNGDSGTAGRAVLLLE
jgi:hypothetical protein